MYPAPKERRKRCEPAHPGPAVAWPLRLPLRAPRVHLHLRVTMYYDDQGRRYNLLSGFVFGALLGAGVGLLLPRRRPRPPLRRVRERADSWAHSAAERAGRTGERARETLAEAVRRGAARARV